MDELIEKLMKEAGLTEAQARAAVDVFVDYMKHEDNRKKVVALAASAATIASAVAVRAI